MNKKEYSFTYIQYKISNLMLIPLCFFVWILADCFERIGHDIVKVTYNIVAVVILILIYNRIYFSKKRKDKYHRLKANYVYIRNEGNRD